MPTKGIYNPLVPLSETQTGGEWLPKAISVFVQVLLIVGFIAMIFYFIYGGIMWITAGGDAKRTEGASKQITQAIVGMGIAAAGWAIISLLDRFFGLNILTEGLKIPTF